MNAVFTAHTLAALAEQEANDNAILDLMIDEEIAAAEEAERRAFYEAQAAADAEWEEQAYNSLKQLKAVIDRATSEQYDLGSEVYSLGRDMWDTLPAEVKAEASWVYDEACLPFYFAEVRKRFGANEADMRIGFEAVEAANIYSDIHKDLYGFRPRW